MTVEVRHTGKDVYIRVEGRSFGSLADQWMHIGGDRIPTGLGVGSARIRAMRSACCRRSSTCTGTGRDAFAALWT
jgi:hypothetical protein